MGLGQRPRLLAQEQIQEVEGFGPQANLLACAEELPAPAVEREIAEQDTHGGTPAVAENQEVPEVLLMLTAYL
jgi:hypothetical protein